MPYYISDKQADCNGWAVIKLENDKPITVACHPTKQDATDQMIAVSMAEGLRPMGQFFAGTAEAARDGGDGNNQVLICDIDDTLIHNGMLIADTADFVAKENVGIMLVTGRLEADRAQTVAQLAKLGMDYDHLYMNNLGSSAKSVEFKKNTAEELLKNYDVTLAIDNDGGARAAYASLGIPVIDPTRLPVKREMNPADQTPDEATTLNGVAVLPCTKEDLALRLKDLLGDTVVFKFLAHGFHWNVRGVNFAQYHSFFEGIYTDADSAIDPIAENIRKLNFDAPIKLSDYLESVDELEPTDSSDPLEMCRSLYMANEDVLESVVHALQVADELEEQGIVNFLAERQDAHAKNQWQLRAIVGDSFAKNYQVDVLAVAEGQSGEGNEKPAEIDNTPANDVPVVNTNPNGAPMVQMNSADTKWAKATEMILRKLEPIQEVPLSEERGSKIETRVNHVDVEMRATSPDGMTFEGYASVFNSPSEPIGGKFTEYVAPGAFKRSLAARNDVKLLWNHDTGQVLGSTRAGTLQLVEDSHGLKAIATLPDTQLGRDAATLIKRGDVANMSFGFSVPVGGDAWAQDGAVRTLNSVRLHEVSIVAFPAYQASTANVRAEVRSIDATLLTEGLTKLENGDDLTPAEADALTGVVAKLTKAEKVEQSLDLLKAKLSLQAKAI
jgi:HK97 family phage prohead protease